MSSPLACASPSPALRGAVASSPIPVLSPTQAAALVERLLEDGGE